MPSLTRKSNTLSLVSSAISEAFPEAFLEVATPLELHTSSIWPRPLTLAVLYCRSYILLLLVQNMGMFYQSPQVHLSPNDVGLLYEYDAIRYDTCT